MGGVAADSLTFIPDIICWDGPTAERHHHVANRHFADKVMFAISLGGALCGEHSIAQLLHHARRICRPKNRTARHDAVRPRLRRRLDGLRTQPAVDLDVEIWVPFPERFHLGPTEQQKKIRCSISIRQLFRVLRSLAATRTLGIISSMKLCPPKPGVTVITSTISTAFASCGPLAPSRDPLLSKGHIYPGMAHSQARNTGVGWCVLRTRSGNTASIGVLGESACRSGSAAPSFCTGTQTPTLGRGGAVRESAHHSRAHPHSPDALGKVGGVLCKRRWAERARSKAHGCRRHPQNCQPPVRLCSEARETGRTSRFDVERELGGARCRHLLHVVFWVSHHEMAVQEGGGVLPERFDDARAYMCVYKVRMGPSAIQYTQEARRSECILCQPRAWRIDGAPRRFPYEVLRCVLFVSALDAISWASLTVGWLLTNGEVLDVVTIHHVNMEPVCASSHHRSALIGQASEVCREDGWRDFRGWSHCGCATSKFSDVQSLAAWCGAGVPHKSRRSSRKRNEKAPHTTSTFDHS